MSESVRPISHHDAEFDEECAQGIIEEALREDTKTQITSAGTNVTAIESQWLDYGFSTSQVETGIELLWFQFCWAGMTASHDDALNQQRIVFFLRNIKDRGVLQREKNDTLRSKELATGRFGTIWEELPLFETQFLDMLQQQFEARHDDDSGTRLRYWRNLNMLAIRISMGSVYDLRVCAVWALQNVLEGNVEVTAAMLDVVLDWVTAYGLWLENIATCSLLGERHAHPVLSSSVARAGSGAPDRIDVNRWRSWRAKLQSLSEYDGDDGSTVGVRDSATAILLMLAVL